MGLLAVPSKVSLAAVEDCPTRDPAGLLDGLLARQAAAYREAWAYVEAVALLPGASDASVLDQRADLLPRPEVYVGDDGWAAFLDGYHAGGGREDWVWAWRLVIYGPTAICANGESGGNPYAVSPLGHKGLLQWADGTWAGVAQYTGYWDVWSAFDNGVNAAWMSQNDNPAQHWSCWP